MKFSKWQGIGNDFVFINGFAEIIAEDKLSATALSICDRHFGIGADGLILVLPSDTADFRMRIFNSDGSEGDMCGNAIRCFAKYVFEAGLTKKTELSIETLAGMIRSSLLFEQGKVTAVRVDMGEPKLERGFIPMTGDPQMRAIDEELSVGDKTYRITGLNMGNPHCVIFVDEVEHLDLRVEGRPIEIHPLFPKKTNVEFVKVIDSQTLRMRVWERGAGPTLACGTGTCASVVAAVLNGKTGRKVLVHLDGGDLMIEWNENNHVYKTGPAVEVFRGEYLM